MTARIGVVLALAALTGACGAKAQVQLPDAQHLNVPAPPARVVNPAPVVETSPPPAGATLDPAGTGAGSSTGARPSRDTPPAKPTPPSPPPPPASPTTPALETTANPAELEGRARNLINTAEKTLEKIDYRSLSGDGKTQYDTAKRFLKQSDEALKAKNVVYAWQLADKANTLATLLAKH